MEKRASKVQKEIEDAVRKVDTPGGVLLEKVRSYGRVEALVVGAYGEFSRHLRKITHAIAESQMGAPRQVRPSAYAVALRYVTRRIARAALVASAEEIVTGLFYSGPGGKARWDGRHTGKRDADMAYREMKVLTKADASQRLGHTHSQGIVWARLLAEEQARGPPEGGGRSGGCSDETANS